MLKHFVFLKLRSDTPDEHINAFCKRMRALVKSIPEIDSLDIGRDEFGESRSWNLMMSMTFESVAALRSYQTHPDHVSAMKFNEAYVTDVGSVDYHEP